MLGSNLIRVLFFALLASVLTLVSPSKAATSSIEISDFANPKRVGVDSFVVGQDSLIVGFDYLPDGTPLASSSIINTAFSSIGLSFSAYLTQGPSAGSLALTEALGLAAVSGTNILSAVDPAAGPGASGLVAGTATLVVDFLAPGGGPGQVFMVGALNDIWFGYNTLTAYAGAGGTGQVLGTVSASGPGDFFGLSSTTGIASITFSGYSTEIDDLIFGPVTAPVPEPSTYALMGLGLGVVAYAARRRRAGKSA